MLFKSKFNLGERVRWNWRMRQRKYDIPMIVTAVHITNHGVYVSIVPDIGQDPVRTFGWSINDVDYWEEESNLVKRA